MKRILTFRLNIVSKKKIKENLEEKKEIDDEQVKSVQNKSNCQKNGYKNSF